jgi:hypothetical protein
VAITHSLECENTLTRDGHAPVMKLQNSRIRWLQIQKATMTMARRRVSGRRRRASVVLASKMKKVKLGQDKCHRRHSQDSPLLRLLTVDLPCQKNKIKENNMKQTTTIAQIDYEDYNYHRI